MSQRFESRGKLNITLGPMFSGKTTTLLKELFIAAEIGLKVLYVNHSYDNRNKEATFSTHNPLYKQKLEKHSNVRMMSISKLSEIADSDARKKYDVIGIDEAQFFPDLCERVKFFVDECDVHVEVVSLDGDSNRTKFGYVLDLIPICDNVTKLTSYCKNCIKENRLRDAIFSHTLVKQKNQVLIGSGDKYTALCRECYLKMN